MFGLKFSLISTLSIFSRNQVLLKSHDDTTLRLYFKDLKENMECDIFIEIRPSDHRVSTQCWTGECRSSHCSRRPRKCWPGFHRHFSAQHHCSLAVVAAEMEVVEEVEEVRQEEMEQLNTPCTRRCSHRPPCTAVSECWYTRSSARPNMYYISFRFRVVSFSWRAFRVLQKIILRLD